MKKASILALVLLLTATIMTGCRRPMDDQVPSESTENTVTTSPTTRPTDPTTAPTTRPTTPTTAPTEPSTTSPTEDTDATKRTLPRQ
ncbi:MAG: hypothetical protein IJW45_07945 [Oscillospiraceae bacterium]|nr:hypothetical protein [Oscillospiraceae bacterium]